MTQLFAHPEVEDYFVEHDFRAIEGSGAVAARQAIIDDLVGEKLILLRGLKFDADMAFLRSVSFHQKWRWKKLALTRFHALPEGKRRADAEISEFVVDVFASDWGKFDYFLEQSARINARISEAMDRMFSTYTFRQRHIIWRFTETRVENLHFDVDRNCDDLELMRLYVNLDDVPRIWYTAGTFSTTASEWYEKLNLAQFRGKPNDALLKRLDTGAYGDWNARGRDKVPRHLVFFEPGDVWIVDGRRIAHQVMFGRRVVSTLFVADPDGVPDVNKTFSRAVATLHQLTSEGKDLRRARLDADAGRVKQRQQVDLRTAWEALPDHVRQESLIRL